MALPQIAGVGSEYFLLGFFLFIVFYIIARLISHRHTHLEKKHIESGELEGDIQDQNNKEP
jgi:hypothetical protein